jgi:protein-S-isoprenylcysteine O-methyltransferase Ste14
VKGETEMNATDVSPSSPNVNSPKKLIARRFIQLGGYVLVMALLLFGAAGTLRWLGAWVFLVTYLGMIAVNAIFILPRDQGLIAERAQPKAGAKGWDKLIVNLIVLVGFLGTLMIAGLDKRFGWSPPLSPWIMGGAFILLVLSYGLSSWAMIANRFFSAYVRIQLDRGHTVVTAGPYRFVRHPAYLAGILSSLATPVLLGSLWALLPAALGAALTVLRTWLEDRTLQTELPGYQDYAGRVKFRLVPGIW